MPNYNIADNIKRLKPYTPGKPVEELQRELGLQDIIKLASNESPLGPSPNAVKAIQDAAANVYFYPEGSAPILRHSVAKHLDLNPDHLIFGNGSDEILLLLCQTLLSDPSDEVIMADPGFAMYDIYATLTNATSVQVPLTEYTHDLTKMADAITPRTRIIFIANPNNPTGTLVTQSQIANFMERVPDTVTVVFDEAYFEYIQHPDKPNTVPYVLSGRNVVVTRTFSKVYALAGLRVGYGIAPLELAGYLNRARSPFNVNLVAQAAAQAALADTEHLRRSVETNNQGKQLIIEGVTKIGLTYVPSEANFVLVDVSASKKDGRAIYDALLHKGVIVRPTGAFGLPNHIRVSIGTESQIRRFIESLSEVIDS